MRRLPPCLLLPARTLPRGWRWSNASRQLARSAAEPDRRRRRQRQRHRLRGAPPRRHRPATCAGCSRPEYGVAPVAYAQTARLLLAKRLLTDTRMPVTRGGAGGGLRQACAASTRSSRSATDCSRPRCAAPPRGPSAVDFPPLRASATPRAVRLPAAARLLRPPGSLPASNWWKGGGLRRSLAVGAADGRPAAGWIEARPAARGPASKVRNRRAPGRRRLPRVLAACKHAFDLDCPPEAVAGHLGELAAARPGLRLPGAFDGFETAVRTIIGQQVSGQGGPHPRRQAWSNASARRSTRRFPGVTSVFSRPPRGFAECAPAGHRLARRHCRAGARDRRPGARARRRGADPAGAERPMSKARSPGCAAPCRASASGPRQGDRHGARCTGRTPFPAGDAGLVRALEAAAPHGGRTARRAVATLGAA